MITNSSPTRTRASGPEAAFADSYDPRGMKSAGEAIYFIKDLKDPAFRTSSDTLIKADEPYTLASRERWGNSLWLRPNDLSRKELLDLLVNVELYEAGVVRYGWGRSRVGR